MPEKIDLSERLFNLTCALLSTRVGLTKQEIFSSVQGYKETFEPNGDNSSLNRMFERDKVTLTETGILWRAFIPKEAMDDNQEYRYLIANEDFKWPKGKTLSAKQVALMNLAAKVWAKASLSSDAQKGLTRIRAMGETAGEFDLIGVAPRIRTHSASFEPITSALEQQRRISFEYKKPGSVISELRVCDPWSLQNISGQWLLIAFDHEKGAARNFLLRRMVSKVKILDEQALPVTSEQIDSAITELRELTEKQKAKIRIQKGGSAWFHFGLAENEDILFLNFMDAYLLAEELMEYVDQIEVLEPKELRELIAENLRRLAKAHA